MFRRDPSVAPDTAVLTGRRESGTIFILDSSFSGKIFICAPVSATPVVLVFTTEDLLSGGGSFMAAYVPRWSLSLIGRVGLFIGGVSLQPRDGSCSI